MTKHYGEKKKKKARSEDKESVGVRARFLKGWSGKTSRGGTFEQRAEGDKE